MAGAHIGSKQAPGHIDRDHTPPHPNADDSPQKGQQPWWLMVPSRGLCLHNGAPPVSSFQRRAGKFAGSLAFGNSAGWGFECLPQCQRLKVPCSAEASTNTPPPRSICLWCLAASVWAKQAKTHALLWQGSTHAHTRLPMGVEIFSGVAQAHVPQMLQGIPCASHLGDVGV